MIPSEVADIADMIFPGWADAEDDVQRDILAAAWRIHNKLGKRIADLEENLDRLVTDVEHKWGDPHTLRHARDALPKTTHVT